MDLSNIILEKEYPRVKANVDKIKSGLTMEKHIHVVEKLIGELLK